MSSDITEEFQVDISNQSTAVVPSVNAGTGMTYDVAFGDIGFFDATTAENPYRRQTAPYRKDQQDNSLEPGEQSLSGWWLRSQSSFHFGAGAKFYEPAQDQNLRFRFESSEGVDVWTAGEVTLLRDVDQQSTLTIATSDRANLRTIPQGVLLKDGDDIYKVSASGTATHLVNWGSDVYAFADDGVYVYWIVNNASKGAIYRKPLSSTSTTTSGTLGDATKMYEHPSKAAAANDIFEYVKDRFIFCIGNTIFSGYSSTTSTAIALDDADGFYVHNYSDYMFTSITASPSDIYISGYQGDNSVIYRAYTTGAFTTTAGGEGFPVLTTVLVVAEFPRGEIVHSIKAYLGYMVIGTSKGVRVAQIQDDGSLVYGPIIFRTEQPVYQIACDDRYVWVTNRIDGDACLTRIDLGTQIEPLRFAYANDLQAIDVAKDVHGVAVVADTNRLAFTTIGTGGKLYIENATRLRSSGFIKPGRIRFNTTEDKFFKYVKERALYEGGSIGISTTSSPIITVDNTNGNSDVGIPETNAADQKQFIFTLNRDSTTNTVGPIFYGYQIKALPAIRRQRLIQYNLFCFDNEMDKFNNRIGYKGRAYERISLFENIEAASDIVTVQDFKTGETYQGLIEEVTFRGETAPHKHFSGFGGILTVTVRKL